MEYERILDGNRKLLRRTFLFLSGAVLAEGLSMLLPSTDTQPDVGLDIPEVIEPERQLTFLEVAQERDRQLPTPPTPSPPPTASISQPAKRQSLIDRPATATQPAQVIKRTVHGVSFYQTTIHLSDPKTYIAIGLAHNAKQANSARLSYGDETFERMVARHHAAVVLSGTFFSQDRQKRVMGNLVSAGNFLKYSPWENYGTTLGIGVGNRLEMITARVDGKPTWNQHWFSLTAGPRLLKGGKVWLAPKSEGFTDPRVLGVAHRSAIGFPRGGKKLVFVTFLSELSLSQAAKVMRAIGCSEAMNLDGGSSLGLAKSSRVLISPNRALTNVILIYDAKHPAPSKLKESWYRFQRGIRPTLPA